MSDLVVVILDRPRNQTLIENVRKAGARIQLIPDGDLSPAIATAFEDSGVDVLAGIGGAPEGVLAAAALRCLEGEMQARLWPSRPGEVERAQALGITDVHRKLTMDDLVRGDDLIFAATGVTTGELLDGVRYEGSIAKTHSIVMRGTTGTIRIVRQAIGLTKALLRPVLKTAERLGSALVSLAEVLACGRTVGRLPVCRQLNRGMKKGCLARLGSPAAGNPVRLRGRLSRLDNSQSCKQDYQHQYRSYILHYPVVPTYNALVVQSAVVAEPLLQLIPPKHPTCEHA